MFVKSEVGSLIISRCNQSHTTVKKEYVISGNHSQHWKVCLKDLYERSHTWHCSCPTTPKQSCRWAVDESRKEAKALAQKQHPCTSKLPLVSGNDRSATGHAQSASPQVQLCHFVPYGKMITTTNNIYYHMAIGASWSEHDEFSTRLPFRSRRRFRAAVRFVVNHRGLFTAGWFGVREKYCFSL